MILFVNFVKFDNFVNDKNFIYVDEGKIYFVYFIILFKIDVIKYKYNM